MSLAPSLASSLRIAQGFPVSASAQVGANTITSPTYAANPNQKVFALCAAWAGTFSGTSLSNSFSGGDIIWTLISATNVNTSEAIALYVGNVVGTPVGTTTAAPTTTASSVYIGILAYENCAGYGWFGSGSSAVSSAVTFTVTAQSMGSMILSIVNDAHGSSVRTSTTTQILDSKTNPGDNDSYWIEAPQEFFKAPGSYTYGGATPNPSGAWASMSIEIQASPVVPSADFPYFALAPTAAPNTGFRQVGGPRQIGKFDPANQFTSPKAYLVPDPPAAPTFWKLQGPAQQVGKSPAGRFRSLQAYLPATTFDPSTVPWLAVLPESFARPQWNPERSESDRAGWTQSLWAVAPTKTPDPVLPERLLLPWNPERSATERAGWTQSLWAVPPVKTPDPVLPEAFARPIWSPDRSHSARAGFTQATWAVPPTAIPEPVLPQSYARPIWSPERTGLARAGWTQALWAVPPQFIPEPVLPQFFYSRQVWNPDRSQLLWNPLQIANIVVPVWGYEMYGPQTFLRPPWNPDRTGFSRAGFTQQLWAVPPTKIPEPVLPAWFTRPVWNPERSHHSSTPLIIPRGPVPTTLPERYPPVWSPERTGVIIAQRIIIAPAPLLSWRPELLERFVQALRSPPNLDLFSPALPPILSTVAIGPPMFGFQDAAALMGKTDLIVLVGRQEMTALQGKQAADGLRGEDDSDPVKGRPG